MFPCLSVPNRCKNKPLSTGQCTSDGISYSCECVPGAVWNDTLQKCTGESTFGVHVPRLWHVATCLHDVAAGCDSSFDKRYQA
jgi:hypothetical protein